MNKPGPNEKLGRNRNKESGLYAVLGMDIEAFSTLHDDDQIEAIERLQKWIHQALNYQDVSTEEYIWSPAGDGGYLTFISLPACRSAVDIAFAICEKANRPAWTPRNRDRIHIRFGIHAGQLHKGADLGGDKNVWGIGINLTSRILAVSAPSQLLVSKQYYDSFIKGQRDDHLEIGEPFYRTMKHGQQIEVMNITRGDICLRENNALSLRWQSIGGLWLKTRQEYTYLINDAMHSNDPTAALASAKFILSMGEEGKALELCRMVGQFDREVTRKYPKRFHKLFSKMEPDIILRILKNASPRFLEAGEDIGIVGHIADKCFFPVAGTIIAQLPIGEYTFSTGDIVGEFGLWVPNIKRTATLTAKDSGLCLEISTKAFKQIIPEGEPAANEVYSLIQRRIIENVISSQRFFPGLSDAEYKRFTCEKHFKGDELNLEKKVYILFMGEVEIQPYVFNKIATSKKIPNSSSSNLIISAEGRIGSEEALGIVSRAGNPDGPVAKVRKESVTVSISREKLISLQLEHSRIKVAWDMLYGKRVGEIAEMAEK